MAWNVLVGISGFWPWRTEARRHVPKLYPYRLLAYLSWSRQYLLKRVISLGWSWELPIMLHLAYLVVSACGLIDDLDWNLDSVPQAVVQSLAVPSMPHALRKRTRWRLARHTPSSVRSKAPSCLAVHGELELLFGCYRLVGWDSRRSRETNMFGWASLCACYSLHLVFVASICFPISHATMLLLMGTFCGF